MLTFKEEKSIKQIHDVIENIFSKDRSGHDFEHIKRVVNLTARFITNEDEFTVLAIAYMHDLFDDKINPVADLDNAFMTFIENHEINLLGRDKQVLEGIQAIGFKGGFNKKRLSPEAQIVSDADYLDAMGAIGIARCFYYAGSKGQVLYDHEEIVEIHSEEEYRNKERTAINHFDEKLLKLQDKIINPIAKDMAKERHQFLLDFYNRFWKEVK